MTSQWFMGRPGKPRSAAPAPDAAFGGDVTLRVPGNGIILQIRISPRYTGNRPTRRSPVIGVLAGTGPSPGGPLGVPAGWGVARARRSDVGSVPSGMVSFSTGASQYMVSPPHVCSSTPLTGADGIDHAASCSRVDDGPRAGNRIRAFDSTASAHVSSRTAIWATEYTKPPLSVACDSLRSSVTFDSGHSEMAAARARNGAFGGAGYRIMGCVGRKPTLKSGKQLAHLVPGGAGPMSRISRTRRKSATPPRQWESWSAEREVEGWRKKERGEA